MAGLLGFGGLAVWRAGGVRFAYADPPYLGTARKRYPEHPESWVYDTLEGHAALIEQLADFDGWALSMASKNLRDLLPLCPEKVRVLAWVKPFTTFWPNVNPAWAWEPIVIRQLRVPPRPTVRDWTTAVSPAQRGGYTGQKPETVCHWLFTASGLTPDDELTDLFPGSGAVARAWDSWRNQQTLGLSA